MNLMRYKNSAWYDLLLNVYLKYTVYIGAVAQELQLMSKLDPGNVSLSIRMKKKSRTAEWIFIQFDCGEIY
jgi:hypothetical protein